MRNESGLHEKYLTVGLSFRTFSDGFCTIVFFCKVIQGEALKLPIANEIMKLLLSRVKTQDFQILVLIAVWLLDFLAPNEGKTL